MQLHLAAIFAGSDSGFYVDVGGGHPVADNVSYWFYLKGWRGLVVEPQKHLADLYAHLRPRDITVQTLVGSHEGETDFHVVSRLHGFSTMIAENTGTATDFGATFATMRMPITRLSALTSAHGVTAIDFLKIDVEGAEADVLAGADWQHCRPRLVLVEAVAPGSMADSFGDWEPQLIGRGYRFVFFDGLNRFYVAEEAADLVARCPCEPAPWDVVQHLYDCGRADERSDHPDHALARVLVRGLLGALPTLDPTLLRDLVLRARRDALPSPDELDHLLFGTADFPGPSSRTHGAGPDLASHIDWLMNSDRFRAALGRIAAAYDGGHVID